MKTVIAALIAAAIAMCGVSAVADQATPSPAFAAAAEKCVDLYGTAAVEAQSGQSVSASESRAVLAACDGAAVLALQETPPDNGDAMMGYAYATTAAYNVAGSVKDACGEFSKAAAVAQKVVKDPNADPDAQQMAGAVLEQFASACAQES